MLPAYAFTNANTLPWRPSAFAQGVSVKDLGAANGRAMQLVRFAPGTAFPLHTHSGPEFVYLLEGDATQEGQHLRPGWASVAAAGTVDTAFHSAGGCIFLTVYSDEEGPT